MNKNRQQDRRWWKEDGRRCLGLSSGKSETVTIDAQRHPKSAKQPLLHLQTCWWEQTERSSVKNESFLLQFHSFFPFFTIKLIGFCQWTCQQHAYHTVSLERWGLSCSGLMPGCVEWGLRVKEGGFDWWMVWKWVSWGGLQQITIPAHAHLLYEEHLCIAICVLHCKP